MNTKNIRNQKISLRTSLGVLLALIVVIIFCSVMYYKKVSRELAISNMNLTPIVAKVSDGVAEVNYFATATKAKILARYPKGDKAAADYIYGEIAKFNSEIGNSGYVDSAPNQFVAPYSTSTSKDTSTVIFKIYKFAGGAHGNQYSKAIIRDNANNIIEVKYMLARYDMKKIVMNVESALKNEYYKMANDNKSVSTDEYYKSELGKNALRWIKEGSAATSTNYNVAWLDGDNLNVYISQYQAWPYVYGDYTVTIPLNQIRK